MRLLIVSQYFWPESFRVNDMATGLRELGHEVTVLTGMPNYPGGELYPGYGWLTPSVEAHEGIRICRVPLVTRGRSKGLRLVVNYLSFALAACVLGPLRCRGRFDLVLIYEPSPITVALPGLLMARLSRAPAVLWIQDLWPDTLAAMGFGRRSLLYRCASWLSGFIHRRCDRLLVQSPGFTPRLRARGIPADRIDWLPNWAEAFYHPVAPGAGGVTPLDAIPGFKILFAGNIGSAQAFETIIDAAARLRDVPELHWVILGDGLMRDWVSAETAQLGLSDRFHVLGQRPAREMPACFSSADVLLVTLRADPVFALTIPSKVQSYLACARPVVAAIDGDGAEILRASGAAVVCAAGDGAALAEAVLRVYRMNPEQRAACGEQGRRYYEQHFDRDLLLGRLNAWIQQMKAAG